MYAVDDEQSFYNLDTWKREFLYYADVKDPEMFPFVVLGNKVDLHNNEVPREQVDSWCSANGKMNHYDTSAKNSINVDQAFVASVERWLQQEQTLDKQMKPGTNYTNPVNLKKQGNQNKTEDDKFCC